MRRSPLPVAFGAFGLVWGAWQAVLPDLAGHYELSSGPLGAMLTLGFAVSLPAMLLAGRLLDRLGAGWGIGLPAVTMALGLLLLALLPPLPLLVLAVIMLASGSGAYDVAINGTAMGDGAWSRPARLTLLHAAFSGGGVVGALGGGALLGAGVRFTMAYPVLAASLAATALLAASAPWTVGAAREPVPRAVALAMLPLAALAGLAFLVEGSMETWSAIYLRDVLGAAAVVGALGPAAFHAAMLGGRLIGAGVAGSLGAPATLLLAGSMTMIGMGAALLLPLPAPAIAAMTVAALGVSFAVPVVVSLAARRSGPHAGQAASYVLTLGYVGFLIGPSLVGMVGEMGGLRLALGVVPVAGMLIAVASRTRVARSA